MADGLDPEGVGGAGAGQREPRHLRVPPLLPGPEQPEQDLPRGPAG